MHSTTERFMQKAKKDYNLNIEVQEFPEGTKTAKDAAKAINCELGQIVKSIVMKADERIIVVLTSGKNRVSTSKLSKYLNISEEKIDSANPEEVKEKIGWSIGGVPPFLHEKPVQVLMDESLFEFNEVWAAAGTPKAVFRTKPDKLEELSEAEIAEVFQ